MRKFILRDVYRSYYMIIHIYIYRSSHSHTYNRHTIFCTHKPSSKCTTCILTNTDEKDEIKIDLKKETGNTFNALHVLCEKMALRSQLFAPHSLSRPLHSLVAPSSLSVSLSLSISLYPSLSLSFSLSQTHVANSKHQIDVDLPADFFYDILSLRLQCVHISQKRITIRTCGRDGE